jgi:3-oxoacyl-[acyl-carrier protein] reductase
MTQPAGKTCLVTGVSRSIGRASAPALAESGVQVLVHYEQAAMETEAVVAEIVRKNGRAKAVAGAIFYKQT